ncbi:MAG: asparaginase [Myxococcota bacterium]|nr:asparaginase [Myxococcota bacterium]
MLSDIKSRAQIRDPAHKEPHSTPPLTVEYWRGDVLESQHEVHAVLVGGAGATLASAGSPALLSTARSALKPFQLWAGLSRGVGQAFNFSSEEVAFMCASHNGEPKHVALCEALLEKLGREVGALECGSHAPYHAPSAEAVLRQGGVFTAAHNNCSGKHCGILAFAEHLDATHRSYLEASHPTQVAIFESICELLQTERQLSFGVDGCSLPTPALQLDELARLFSRLASARALPGGEHDPALEKICQAMNQAPDLVAGTGRFDTEMMRAYPSQVVSKVGGEAIRGLALRSSSGAPYGVALKVRDGAMRALHPATLAFLARCGMISSNRLPDPLRAFEHAPEQNWRGRTVTKMRVAISDSLESGDTL